MLLSMMIAAAWGETDPLPPEPIVDCGTAAVYCLCRFQGTVADFGKVREALAPCGTAPYSMADLQQALAKLGVATQAVTARESELPDRTAFLAYLQTGAIGHFSTCRLNRAENRAELVDTRESWHGTPAELVRRYGWTGIVLTPTSPRWPRWAAAFAGLGLGAVGMLFVHRRPG